MFLLPFGDYGVADLVISSDRLRKAVGSGLMSEAAAELLFEAAGLTRSAVVIARDHAGEHWGEYAGYRLEYMACRGFKHPWDEDFLYIRRGPYGVEETYRCPRCAMLYVQAFDALGRENGSRRYIQPEGWKLPRTLAYFSKQDFRAIIRQAKLEHLVESGAVASKIKVAA